MKILYNTGSEFKESKESAENLSVKIINDNGDTVKKTVQKLVSDNFYGIERLIGTEDVNDDHRSVREIARNELAKQLIPEDAKESLDTLHEIADWIQDHPDDASQMNSRINILEEAVPFVLYIQNGVYGYKKENGDFVPFKSQADIDAAVSAAMVGNATAADVLAGKTFTNATTSGVVGTMPSRSNGESAVSTDRANGNRVFFPRGHYPNYATHDGQSWVKVTDEQIVNFANKQETSCTPSTSAQTITPDSGKLLSKVTVAAIPTQRNTSGQAAGNKCWTYNNRVYFGFEYGWYPSGSTFSSMSNVCERYVDYAKVASAVGLTAGKLLSGQTCLGITGTGNSSLSGNAGTGDVRSGKTFYKDSVTKQTGTLADYSGSGHMIACQWGSGNTKRPAVRLANINPKAQIDGSANGQKNYMEIAMPAGIWAYSWGNSSACIPYYTENCTATTSNQTVKASNWNSDAKAVSILDSVVVKPQSQSGTYACPSNWTGSPSTNGNGDMGATNNYRYVNATNVYNKGKADGYPTAVGFHAGTNDCTSASFCEITGFTVGQIYVICIFGLKSNGTNGGFGNAWTISGATDLGSSNQWEKGTSENRIVWISVIKPTSSTVKYTAKEGMIASKWGYMAWHIKKP